MSARDRILDTLEAILISEGERAATLDAVAARAEVSKGGLLYHFPNREALITGLLERLEDQLLFFDGNADPGVADHEGHAVGGGARR